MFPHSQSNLGYRVLRESPRFLLSTRLAFTPKPRTQLRVDESFAEFYRKNEYDAPLSSSTIDRDSQGITVPQSRLRVYITSSSRIYSTPSKTPPRSAKAHTAKQPNSDTDYNPKATRLAAFFAQYAPEFKYQPSNPANHEFHRLQKLKGWKIPKSSKETSKEGQENPTKKKKKKKTKGEKAYKAFQDALVMQFNDTAIGFAPIPDTLKHCQQVVEQTFVNLVDLTEKREPLIKFRTEPELSSYTRKTHRIFPKKNAYARGLLRHLLRKIVRPDPKRGKTARHAVAKLKGASSKER
ncbi:hypothetical protein CC1G_14777 [Coprinopsis cinerea okayama7|uniref:Uncharacterized protein n=1 Tax=Coprinopsis cinerea (strain Okayama-7 / 130 / ATCC MYA-4618 / FGSC 9003) TaxID=240176 RepID=D6RNT7_COPC7|nr:hypothetical protein CC1G_14777 [Coprinopsis cinerea okayama7\|eukprot:XP_002910799.1 hypothetical protein CC1G_14777 [Coprinopsis cinerea okayama7\